ncbi:MAG: class I SAM-dependent methyltransferase [Ignavibacteria bacterium]
MLTYSHNIEVLPLNKFGNEFWNDRYSSNDFVYGAEPNVFFKDKLDKINPGKLLLLGEGEGRNAVYAARNGWNVGAVDFSDIAKDKALKFADDYSVEINYEVSDLATYNPRINYYDAVGIIFLHLNPRIRESVHSRIVAALKPGGTLILEVYDKEQLGKSSGGPQNIDMLYSKEELLSDFKKMKIQELEKKLIMLNESKHHKGKAAVVRLIAIKI